MNAITTVHFQTDLVLRHQFRTLAQLVGSQRIAKSLIHELFFDLALQTKVHGISGLFHRDHTSVFNAEILDLPGGENGLTHLLESKVLTPHEDDWWCDLFVEANPHLDRLFIPPWKTRLKTAANQQASFQAHAKNLVPQIAPGAWVATNGERLLPALMNQALVLIRMLDDVLNLGTRPAADFSIGLVQAAGDIVTRWDRTKIAICLKRMYALENLKAIDAAFRSTECVLAQWDHLMTVIMPAEGFIAWEANSTKAP